VPGGGVALIRASAALANLRVTDEEKTGVRIIQKALQEPARWIAQNAGADGAVVLDKIKNGKGSFGFNAAAEEYEDLVKAGIVDPTKVVRCALQNAASVAGLMITTEAMIADKPEKKKEMPPMPHGDEY
jgi:chaperonin GroEL